MTSPYRATTRGWVGGEAPARSLAVRRVRGVGGLHRRRHGGASRGTDHRVRHRGCGGPGRRPPVGPRLLGGAGRVPRVRRDGALRQVARRASPTPTAIRAMQRRLEQRPRRHHRRPLHPAQPPEQARGERHRRPRLQRRGNRIAGLLGAGDRHERDGDEERGLGHLRGAPRGHQRRGERQRRPWPERRPRLHPRFRHHRCQQRPRSDPPPREGRSAAEPRIEQGTSGS